MPEAFSVTIAFLFWTDQMVCRSVIGDHHNNDDDRMISCRHAVDNYHNASHDEGTLQAA